MNNQQNVSTAYNSPADDEIDLTDLFRNIWKQRGLVAGFVLLFALSVMIFHLAKASFSTPSRIDYPISLTFLDAEGKYPNGATFGIRDVISPSIVQNVIQTSKLPISTDTLVSALSVRASNSLLDITEEKLVTIFTNPKTPQDVRLIADEELKQMREKTVSSITVSLDLDKSGLSAQEGTNVLRNILDAWARMSIERGLTNADISRPAMPFEVHEKLTLIDLYDNAANYFNSLDAAATALKELPGSNSLVINGFTLDDVRRGLKMLNDTDISPLREFAYSKSGELAAVDAAIQVRLYSRQRLLNLEHERLTKMVASYDSVLALLNQSANNESANNGAGRPGSSMGAQMDQSFLDSMLDLGNKLGSVEIRQELFERRTNAVEELLSLEKEIAILTNTSSQKHDGDIDARQVLQASISHIAENLNNLRERLDQLIVVYRDQTLQSNGRMFVADASPVVRGGYTLNTKMALHLVLSMVLGGMVGVLVALIRSAMINAGNKKSLI